MSATKNKFTITRHLIIVLFTLFVFSATAYEAMAGGVPSTGVLIYSTQASATFNLKKRTYPNTYGTTFNVNPSALARMPFIEARPSTIVPEGMIIGGMSATGTLSVIRCSGRGCDAAADFGLVMSTTSVSATLTCGDTTAGSCYRPFDIGQERLQGRMMIAFGQTNQDGKIFYTLWNGASTTTVQSFTFKSGSTADTTWVRLIAQAGDDNLLLVVADTNRALYSAIWDGSTWGNLKEVTNGMSTVNEMAFDGAFETNSGDALVFFATSTANSLTPFGYIKYTDGVGWDSASTTVGAMPGTCISTAGSTSVTGATAAAMGRWIEADSHRGSDRIAINFMGSDATTITTNAFAYPAIWKADDSTPGFTFGSGAQCGRVAENAISHFGDVAWERDTVTPQAMFQFNTGGSADSSMYVLWTNGSYANAVDDGGALADDSQLIRMYSSRSDDEFIILGSSSDEEISQARWNGNSWTNFSQLVAGAGTGGLPPGTSSTNSTEEAALPMIYVGIPYAPWSKNWRWYSGADTGALPTTALASENATTTGADGYNDSFRLRFAVEERGGGTATSTRKKLQYTTGNPDSKLSTWTDVDNVAGSGIWRYVDCNGGSSVCDDGTTITGGTVTTGATTQGWWNSSKDAASTVAMLMNATTTTELEFSIQANNTATGTSYYFRMYDVDLSDSIKRFQPSTTTQPCAGNTVCRYPALTTATSTYALEAYRFYDNNDGTQVGDNPLAAQNATTTLSGTGQEFRLRLLTHIGVAGLGVNKGDFKLQFAEKGGGAWCGAPSGSWTDVTSGTAIAYLNNATPTDGSTMTASTTDPTVGHTVVDQTYEEANNFTNPNAIPSGQDGKWDFSLVDNGATAGGTYCLRVLSLETGSTITYTTYPAVVIATAASAPTVTTSASVGAITQTSATLNGNVTNTGGANATQHGFAWGTSSSLATAATTTGGGFTGTGAFTSSSARNLSGLSCNTTYYYRAYATNTGGTGYGSIQSFLTVACIPTVTTQAESSVTQTSATVNGNITNTGGAGAVVTVRGFAWGTNSALSGGDTATTTDTVGQPFNTGAFTGSLSSLTCNTTYYSRPYATNPGGTGFGSIDSFTTSPCAPTVTTQSASSVTATTATLNGNITATGGANATVRGFAWGTNSALSGGDTATTTENGSFGTGAFTGSLSSLTCNTTYYSRAYATNSAGTSFGAISASFTTSPCIPTVTTNQESSVTQTTATLNGNITATGGASATTRGFAWGTNSALSGGDTATTTENGTFGTGTFTSARSGLTCNTTYYARAYAINSAGNGYGVIDSFVTSPCNPTVTTQSASSVAATTATLNGNITNTGGSNVTTRGFAYSTNSAISTGVSTTTENGSFGTGAYTGSISSLTGNTTYYSRAYGTNPGGTGYGSISAGFLTLPDVTGTPTGGSITATTLTVSWTAPTGGAVTYKIERCTGSGCSSFSELQTGIAGLSYDDSGLSASTVYRYRVRGTNASGDGVYATSADITTSATASTEQSAYRFFSAADSYTPGGALANQDTPATLGSASDPFRLRMLIHFGTSNVALNERSFKLQFAEKSGTCDASFTGETYADVTGATVIAYRDTTGVTDNTALGAQADLTHGADTIINQTYEEANNFTNSQSTISSGQDAKWDFSLIDNGAAQGASYCFRVVQSSGAVLSSYSQIPEIAIPAGSPALSQAHYRWRSDNGSEVGASYETAEDTAISNGAFIGARRRLRTIISNSGTGSATGYTYRLEHSSSTCSVWLPVPTTATTQHWVMDLSPHVSDGAVTTDSSGLTNPGGKTFTTGQVRTYQNQTGALNLSNSQFTELEYSIKSTSNAVTDVLYCFRLTNAGSTANFTYTQRPEITLKPNPGNPAGGGGNGNTGENDGSGEIRRGGGGGGGSNNATGEGQGSGGQQTGGGGGGGGGLE